MVRGYMPLWTDLCNFCIHLTQGLLIWFHKLHIRIYEVCKLSKVFLSEKERLDYHFDRIESEDRDCTHASISAFNISNMRVIIKIQ